MLKTTARLLRLAARYAENPRALGIKRLDGIPGTFWKLDQPWFHALGLRSVIDIGANEGQFSTTLRCLLPEADIFAFEPIPECHRRIGERFARDRRFHLSNLALAERKGSAKFTVASGDTGASSLLPMAEAQKHHFPHTAQSHEIEVSIDTLDNVLSTEKPAAPYLLKIDVQGYEYQVLAGGTRTLATASLVVLEASYEPFYEGQKLFDEVYDFLRAHRFRLLDMFNMMHSPDDGRALQGDFLFVKSE